MFFPTKFLKDTVITNLILNKTDCLSSFSVLRHVFGLLAPPDHTLAGSLALQSLLSLSSHLSVDGLIVSGVAGGGVLGRACAVVVDDVVAAVPVGDDLLLVVASARPGR